MLVLLDKEVSSKIHTSFCLVERGSWRFESSQLLGVTSGLILSKDVLFKLLFVLMLLTGKLTKEVRSRNVTTLNTDNFKTDILSVLLAVSGTADTASAYNACLRELLDKHAPLGTRCVTLRRPAPWMTMKIKKTSSTLMCRATMGSDQCCSSPSYLR